MFALYSHDMLPSSITLIIILDSGIRNFFELTNVNFGILTKQIAKVNFTKPRL